MMLKEAPVAMSEGAMSRQSADELGFDERARRLMAMGQMAASLAHEIRNPLGSMELYCSLLKKDLSEQPELYSLAEEIHRGIKTLDRVIHNCLQFARDVRPKKKEIADVRGFFEEVVKELSGKTERAGVEVLLEVGEGEGFADSYLLKQALVNLVSNAIDAVRERGAEDASFTGRVKIKSEIGNNGWRIEITDNGVGISEEALGNVFDPFFTTKERGTGLGLAVVHTIIQAHGGKVSIKSQKNLGTTVEIVI